MLTRFDWLRLYALHAVIHIAGLILFIMIIVYDRQTCLIYSFIQIVVYTV
jgi:hypothetical protein